MTDKQIIIDGVNVSGCEYYRHTLKGKDFPKWCIKTHINYGDGCKYQGHCYNFPYCLYKEGKRENKPVTTKDTKEDLKTKVKQLSVMVKCSYNDNKRKHEQLKRKEQECEELAYENYELNELFDRLKAENDELKKQHQADKGLITSTGKMNYQLLQEYDKLKTALTEIKEIAITGLEGFCPKCSRKECEDNNCIETAIRDILQKISEVEDAS